MYIQKKNNTWWLRKTIYNPKGKNKSENINLGTNFNKAKDSLYLHISLHDERQKLFAKMDEIEAKNPTTSINIKLTISEYKEIENFLPEHLKYLI